MGIHVDDLMDDGTISFYGNSEFPGDFITDDGRDADLIVLGFYYKLSCSQDPAGGYRQGGGEFNNFCYVMEA